MGSSGLDGQSSDGSFPIWDEVDVLKRVMGQEEILKLLLEAYFNDMPNYINSLTDSLNNQDLIGASKLAHTIKGAAGNLSALALAEKAKIIESLSHDESEISLVQAQYDELLSIFDQTNKVLSDWQSEHS